MGVEDEQARWLLYMVVGAFLLGLIVYFVNDEYRFRKIIRSNQNYYSHVDVEKP